jgi:hypothetical protein
MNDCSYIDIIILPTGALVNRGRQKISGNFLWKERGRGWGMRKNNE